MHLKNKENIEPFYIDKEWYKNRKRGISALLRVKDEEEFIAPCLLSIEHFFDEIVIALNGCTDSTPQIIKELNLSKVKVLEYPFNLHHNGPGHDEIAENSIRDNAYFYNWTLSKSRYQNVCKWDGDMVALPNLNNRLRKTILKNNVVNITGINISGEELACKSKDAPDSTEPRFFRVSKDTYYRQGKMTQYLTHNYKHKVSAFQKPVFLHFKNAKSLKSATKIWPSNWREVDHFKKLSIRREKDSPYKGVYPESLKNKIINRSISYAEKVEELKTQEEVMRNIGELLFALRNRLIFGDIVEIGSKLGKTTVFISKIMETLFPENMIYSIDPYTVEGSKNSLKLEDDSQIVKIYELFQENTSGLNNHKHFKIPSGESANLIPQNIIFSFIDGEHTHEAVINDFRIILDKTIYGGIIAVDDYKNEAWPGVKKAYEEIIKSGKVLLIKKDIKAAYFIKNPGISSVFKRSIKVLKKSRIFWAGSI